MNLLSVLGELTKETLALIHDQAFFERSPAEREKWLKTEAPNTYPASLQSYLVTVSPETYVQELKQAVSLLSTQSLPKELLPTGFWTACAYSIQERLDLYGTSLFLQEAQPFIERVSPLRFSFVQTPIALTPEEQAAFRASLHASAPDTIALFSVEASLGGGARLFHRGTVTDRSWSGKATHLLDHLFAH